MPINKGTAVVGNTWKKVTCEIGDQTFKGTYATDRAGLITVKYGSRIITTQNGADTETFARVLLIEIVRGLTIN
jgi:Ca2+-binding RTX toxin-like protein